MISCKLNDFLDIELVCPSCGEQLSANSRTCQSCGVDLAVAALLAEQQALMPVRFPIGAPISLEVLVPRIGDFLIERGMLKSEQLQEALVFQEKHAQEGKPILLGRALLELGLISRETLDEVVTAQILELQNALRDANHMLKQRVEERTRELRQALERLSELNQLKSNFVANISHELRTPLTHIKGYLDILVDGGLGQLNEDQIDAIEVLKKAELRLEHLIEDLIQFSLASRGDISLTRGQVPPLKMVAAVVERSQHKAEQQKIRLTAICPEALPCVYADEDKISWVLLQLLDNGFKFTPPGGEVSIEVAANRDQLVRFVISDTGIGIPADRISEIFEPFHQLDSSATRRYSGTGLGLAMVKRIIEAHGTNIQVKSEVGKGSKMEFELPIGSTTA